MEPITVSVQLTPEDYIAATRLHSRRSTWLGRHLSLIVLLYIVMMLLFYLEWQDSGAWVMPVTLFMAVLAGQALTWWIWVPRRCRKIFAQQRGLQRPYTMEFGDTGMQFRSEGVSSSRPWSEFHKWVEGPEQFLLYYSDIMFNMLPKRFIADPARLRELFSARIAIPTR